MSLAYKLFALIATVVIVLWNALRAKQNEVGNAERLLRDEILMRVDLCAVLIKLLQDTVYEKSIELEELRSLLRSFGSQASGLAYLIEMERELVSVVSKITQNGFDKCSPDTLQALLSVQMKWTRLALPISERKKQYELEVKGYNESLQQMPWSLFYFLLKPIKQP